MKILENYTSGCVVELTNEEYNELKKLNQDISKYKDKVIAARVADIEKLEQELAKVEAQLAKALEREAEAQFAKAFERETEAQLDKAVDTMKWMSNHRAHTILIEEPEHVKHFFSRLDECLKEIKGE